jgi:hypothetical protein
MRRAQRHGGESIVVVMAADGAIKIDGTAKILEKISATCPDPGADAISNGLKAILSTMR